MANLYVFHQGQNNEGYLWFSAFDGTHWSTDYAITNAEGAGSGMTAAPSALAIGEYLFVFHQGYAVDGQLWSTYTQDFFSWVLDTPVPHLGISESPSAVLYNGSPYVFHQGGGNNGQLWYTFYDGTWEPDTQIQPLGMSGSPSAVVWDGGITVFHQGNGDGQLWYTYSPDGTNWGGDTLVQSAERGKSVGITDSAAPLVF